MFDKHPVARNYVHWMLSNIPGNCTELKEGQKPPLTTIVVKTYAGPFPPSGTHEYEVILYALSADQLDLTPKPNLETLTSAAEKASIDSAVLTFTFTKIRS